MGGAYSLGAFASINRFGADGTRQTLVIDRSELERRANSLSTSSGPVFTEG
jgi:hypothetical protein